LENFFLQAVLLDVFLIFIYHKGYFFEEMGLQPPYFSCKNSTLMSSDILAVLEYMEKDKGIERSKMITAIAAAIRTAAEKADMAGQNLVVDINPKTGALKASIAYTVVDSVADPKTQIHFEKAYHFADHPKLGDTVHKPIDPGVLGRIAAQTVRQTINQSVRQFEKERIFEDYKDQVGEIVSGVVRRREKDNIIVDLGKAEALLPRRERVPTEEYAIGDSIRALLLEIETTARGPEIILSRANPRFVQKLLELEIAEIADGTVIIKAFARDPGFRTKIAVESTDPKVDPVGACVGTHGARVKGIMRELLGERLDVIRFQTDPKRFLEEAVRPVIPRKVRMDPEEKRIYFEVPEEEIGLVLRHKGRNAKLIAEIIGWSLDIAKEHVPGAPLVDHRYQKAVEGISHIPGLSEDHANRLVAIGITTPDAFEGVTGQDLQDAGFTLEEANAILSCVRSLKETT
jgi:N utilization substance protein A